MTLSPQDSATRTRRRGFTVLELMATVILLGAVLLTLPPVLRQAAVQRRDAGHRQTALLEVQNALERLTARPYASITPDAARGVALSESARSLLREPRLTISLSETNDPAGKRIAAELRWQDRAGNDAAPVLLTTWVFEPVEN